MSQTTITIPLPTDEKAILTDFCDRTGRSQTDVVRAFVRSLVAQLPFYYGLVGTMGSNPTTFMMKGGKKLTEEEFATQHEQAYLYWKMSNSDTYCPTVQVIDPEPKVTAPPL